MFILVEYVHFKFAVLYSSLTEIHNYIIYIVSVNIDVIFNKDYGFTVKDLNVIVFWALIVDAARR